MINIPLNVLKEFGIELKETIKNNPKKTVLKIALVVTTLAAAILTTAFFWPLAPLPIVIGISVGVFAISGTVPSLLFVEEIKTALFSLFKKNHPIDKVVNRDLILVLEAKSDHNQAFQTDGEPLFHKIEKKIPLAFAHVSNLAEIAENINKVLKGNNRIKGIWFRAHGNPLGMILSDKTSLNTHNLWLLKHHLKKIDPKGFILLDSCSTGGRNPRGGLNFAQKMAETVPGIAVIAPSKDTDQTSLKFNLSKTHFEISFRKKRLFKKSENLTRLFMFT